MRSFLSFVLLAVLSSALGTVFPPRDHFSIYERNLLDSEHDSHLDARAAILNSHGGIRTRQADNDDDFMLQQLELQQQLQKVANDPEAVRKIQMQQLDLMKKQQDGMNVARGRKPQIGRRSMHVRAPPAPPPQQRQQQQMIADQQKQIAQQQGRDKATQQTQLQQRAEATARTPGAGVGAGATITKIVPGISARALLRRMAEALAQG